ncbi:Holliday junction branch migration DNA helicase RuvB [Candidatus Collierbacteria bacterium]|nr:Holliday junction branch migration DNA helicase RuvB [Candidatus Collierbacteria bacterium]
MKDQKTESREQKAEEIFDSSLRPSKFDEFTGQSRVIENLKVTIEAAKNRKEPLDHLLLYGPPGLGKTTLAHIIAAEMGVNIRITSGPAIERSGDLASILTNLQEGDILFIDEVHRLHKVVEEMLYPAMEDFALDIILGKGPSARTVRLDLPKFTLIGATTRVGLIGSPMRDRFGIIHRLNFYEDEELCHIVKRSSRLLKMEVDQESALEVAKRSRGTPRIANRLLKRSRDFSQVRFKGLLNRNVVDKALQLMGVDLLGLDESDRRILSAIINKHGGGPVGVETIAATAHEDIGTIEDVFEPFLMQIGFLKRTPRGRVATKKAYQHLGLSYPQSGTGQESLL